MIFNVEYLENVTKKEIPELPKNIRATVKRAIEDRLAVNPLEIGKPLRGTWRGYYRIRVSDYRIVYRMKTPATILVTRIRHRKDVYH